MTQFANKPNKNVKFTVQNISPIKKTISIFNVQIGFGRSRNLLEIPGIDEAAIAASLLKGALRTKLDAGEIEVTANTTSIGVKDKDYSDYLQSKQVLNVYSGDDLPEAYTYAPGSMVWYTETNSPIYSDGTTWRDANGTDIEMIPLEAISSDYIVVGLGTAGSALARLLTDDMTTSVTVLEAGQDRSDDSRVQQGAPFGDSTMASEGKYCFLRPANPADISVPIAGAFVLADGRLWGGGSSVNGTVAVRGSADIYDLWGAIDPQWSYSSLLPLMKALENYVPTGTTANSDERGSGGYITITQDAALPSDPLYTAIETAANCPRIDDYNDQYGHIGLAAAQWFVDAQNKRFHAIRGFLPSSVIDSNGKGVGSRKLSIISQATVIEVIIKNTPSGKVAKGVRFFYNNEPGIVREAYANKKVILCAGSIANAQILQLSGVGPSALLESLGIPVKVANDNVGRNMQNHYGGCGLIPVGANAAPAFQIGHVYSDLSGANTGQANDGYRRAQLYTVPGNFMLPRGLLSAMGVYDTPAVSILGFIMSTNKLGEVSIVSQDPLTPPKITCSFYKDTGAETDMDKMVRMFKVMANISVEYSGSPPLYPPPAHYPAPWGSAPDDSLLIQDAKDATLTAAFHNTGTCRMGTSIADGVVDGNLDVFGVKNLSCADNSVIPEIPTANTCYSAYVIGLKKAEIEGATIP